MKRLILFVPLVIFLAIGALFYGSLGKNPEEMPSALIGKPLPTFTLKELHSNQTITNADLDGEMFLLNVWATWCRTCLYEHPHLLKLSDSKQIKIIGVNYKDESDKAKQWLKKLKNPYTLNLVDDEGTFGLDLGVYGAPETYLIDSKGVVRYRYAGEFNDQVWVDRFLPLIQQLNVE